MFCVQEDGDEQPRRLADTSPLGLIEIVRAHFPDRLNEFVIQWMMWNDPLPVAVQSDTEATSSSVSTTQLEDPV